MIVQGQWIAAPLQNTDAVPVFFRFRMIRLAKWPQSVEDIRPEQFTAIAAYSAIRRTGHILILLTALSAHHLFRSDFASLRSAYRE